MSSLTLYLNYANDPVALLSAVAGAGLIYCVLVAVEDTVVVVPGWLRRREDRRADAVYTELGVYRVGSAPTHAVGRVS